MNQAFDLPVEEYVYLSGKPPAKADDVRLDNPAPEPSQAVNSTQAAAAQASNPAQVITPHASNPANQLPSSYRSGPRLVQSPIFQIPRDDQPIGQHLERAQRDAAQATVPVASMPVNQQLPPAPPPAQVAPMTPAPPSTTPVIIPSSPVQPTPPTTTPLSRPVAPAPTVATRPSPTPVTRQPNPVFADQNLATPNPNQTTPASPIAPPTTTPPPNPPINVVQQPTSSPVDIEVQRQAPPPTPAPSLPPPSQLAVTQPPANPAMGLPTLTTLPSAPTPPMLAPPVINQPPPVLTVATPPIINQATSPGMIDPAPLRSPVPDRTVTASRPTPPPPSPPGGPSAAATTPSPMHGPATTISPQMLARQVINNQATGAQPPATPAIANPAIPNPPPQTPPPINWSARPAVDNPAGMMPPPPSAIATTQPGPAHQPPPNSPPPIQGIATNGHMNGLPPISPVQPGEVTLPETNQPRPLVNPLAPEPPPSFQPAGLANKSAADTSPQSAATSSRSAITQRTKSLSVAIRAATLAKPVMAGGGDGTDLTVHDPDFGIYSHSEQVRHRHYYSRLTLNMFAVLFIGGMVVSVWSFWPKLSGWWAGITKTDQQYFNDIIDGLLTTDVQKYQVELETTIGQFGQTDPATISGEFVARQPDPTAPGPTQSSIELDFKHQLSVATANTPARHETIVLGVDQIHNPDNQNRYFRIRPLEFNQTQVALTDLHQTWTQLGQSESLTDGQSNSLLLNLADNLTTNYNHHDYTLLLPTINLSNPAQRDQARDYLITNSPYHSFDCQVVDSDSNHLVTCQLLVKPDKVYQFYQYVYLELLETTVPARYADLQQFKAHLPELLELTIDTQQQQPAQLVVRRPRSIAGQTTTEKLTIDYQPGADDQIEIPPRPLLEIDSYRQRVQQFEVNNL